jgi:hypothetical protein
MPINVEYRISKQWILIQLLGIIILFSTSLALFLRGQLLLPVFFISLAVYLVYRLYGENKSPILEIKNNYLIVKNGKIPDKYDLHKIKVKGTSNLFGLEVEIDDKTIVLPTKQLSKKDRKQLLYFLEFN